MEIEATRYKNNMLDWLAAQRETCYLKEGKQGQVNNNSND